MRFSTTRRAPKMESGSPPPPPPISSPPPPPPHPYSHEILTESRFHLGKTVWRAFMITNFSIAAYLLLNTNNKKKKSQPAQAEVEAPSPQPVPPPQPVISPPQPVISPPQPMISPPQPEIPPEVDFGYDPYIVPSSAASYESLCLPAPKPIPEDQQKVLFQWMLEEKRKIKPKDQKEKKIIDQEKAILKQFIRADSLPRI